MATARARGAHVPYLSCLLSSRAGAITKVRVLGECGRRGALEGAAALPEMLRTPHCAGLGEFATAPIGRSHPNLGRGQRHCFVCLPFSGSPHDFGFKISKFETRRSSRQTCAPFSTPSWPPRFPSSQVRLPPLLCAAEHWNAAGTTVGLAVSCGGRRTGSADRAPARRAPQVIFFRPIAFGLQASASSSPRRFRTRSLRRPPVGPPPHRLPSEQLSSEGLHRPSRASFPASSSPSRFPASQVRLRSLCARA